MRSNRSLLIGIILATVLIGTGLAVNAFWILPQLHARRLSIDNDRASITLAKQQQSNLDKLGRDLDSIKDKQAGLDADIWKFAEEDIFFQIFEKLGATKDLVVDAPNISDATPNGSILTRTVTVKMQCSLPACLRATTNLQKTVPLMALRLMKITGGSAAGTVDVTLEAVTLWQ